MKHEVNGTFVFIGIIIGCLFGVFGTGCVAQKADLQKIHKDLDQQIAVIRVEKKELEKELEAARGAIAESRNLISAQKTEMSKMRSDMAPMNQQIKLLREQDLTIMYGQIEVTEKKVSDLRQDFVSQTEKLGGAIQALQTTTQAQGERQQLTQTQADFLAQQIDAKNQVLTEKMTEFQNALGQFKETLGSLSNDISQARTSIGTLRTDAATQSQTLSTLQSQADNIGHSIAQVKQALEQSGTAM